MTPYAEALHWIERHPDTGSGVGLAKLILSLWNTDCGYSFRECVSAFDEEPGRWHCGSSSILRTSAKTMN